MPCEVPRSFPRTPLRVGVGSAINHRLNLGPQHRTQTGPEDRKSSSGSDGAEGCLPCLAPCLEGWAHRGGAPSLLVPLRPLPSHRRPRGSLLVRTPGPAPPLRGLSRPPPPPPPGSLRCHHTAQGHLFYSLPVPQASLLHAPISRPPCGDTSMWGSHCSLEHGYGDRTMWPSWQDVSRGDEGQTTSVPGSGTGGAAPRPGTGLGAGFTGAVSTAASAIQQGHWHPVCSVESEQHVCPGQALLVQLTGHRNQDLGSPSSVARPWTSRVKARKSPSPVRVREGSRGWWGSVHPPKQRVLLSETAVLILDLVVIRNSMHTAQVLNNESPVLV